MGNIGTELQITDVDINPSSVSVGYTLVLTVNAIEAVKTWGDYTNVTWGSISNLKW